MIRRHGDWLMFNSKWKGHFFQLEVKYVFSYKKLTVLSMVLNKNYLSVELARIIDWLSVGESNILIELSTR